jgi:DNA mismatch repair ATPase MutS
MIDEKTESGEFNYTYKMRPGISTLEGGIAILKTMDYPVEILNTITSDSIK